MRRIRETSGAQTGEGTQVAQADGEERKDQTAREARAAVEEREAQKAQEARGALGAQVLDPLRGALCAAQWTSPFS